LRNAAEAAGKPFIYLSEGVSNKTFDEALQLAGRPACVFSGVLCGRATWKDGVEVYAKNGLDALEAWLKGEGVENIRRVNKRLSAAASWRAFYGDAAKSTPAR